MACLYFIADFHQNQHPNESPVVLDFFERVARKKQAEAIYILGDFFEFWWGDDHQHAPYQAWEAYFAAYPIKIYFLPGNRDFFCGPNFFKKAHIIPISSGHTLFYGGHRIGLFHGDEPGLLDWKYQIFRRISRSSLKTAFLWLPEPWRKSFCLKGRALRKEQPASYTPLKIDLKRWLKLTEHPIDICINGHLHIPLTEKYETVTRYQLGSWDNQHHSFIRIDDSGEISMLSGSGLAETI